MRKIEGGREAGKVFTTYMGWGEFYTIPLYNAWHQFLTTLPFHARSAVLSFHCSHLCTIIVRILLIYSIFCSADFRDIVFYPELDDGYVQCGLSLIGPSEMSTYKLYIFELILLYRLLIFFKKMFVFTAGRIWVRCTKMCIFAKKKFHKDLIRLKEVTDIKPLYHWQFSHTFEISKLAVYS